MLIETADIVSRVKASWSWNELKPRILANTPKGELDGRRAGMLAIFMMAAVEAARTLT